MNNFMGWMDLSKDFVGIIWTVCRVVGGVDGVDDGGDDQPGRRGGIWTWPRWTWARSSPNSPLAKSSLPAQLEYSAELKPTLHILTCANAAGEVLRPLMKISTDLNDTEFGAVWDDEAFMAYFRDEVVPAMTEEKVKSWSHCGKIYSVDWLIAGYDWLIDLSIYSGFNRSIDRLIDWLTRYIAMWWLEFSTNTFSLFVAELCVCGPSVQSFMQFRTDEDLPEFGEEYQACLHSLLSDRPTKASSRRQVHLRRFRGAVGPVSAWTPSKSFRWRGKKNTIKSAFVSEIFSKKKKKKNFKKIFQKN